jgi:hypothetical protein
VIRVAAEAGDLQAMTQWLWTQKQDIGPSQRMRHAMAYDGAHKLVLLFGGDANALNNDTWAWDGQVWTQVADTGPIPRALHAMTFDSVRQRTVLFGGYNGSLTGSNRYFNDTWEEPSTASLADIGSLTPPQW